VDADDVVEPAGAEAGRSERRGGTETDALEQHADDTAAVNVIDGESLYTSSVDHLVLRLTGTPESDHFDGEACRDRCVRRRAHLDRKPMYDLQILPTSAPATGRTAGRGRNSRRGRLADGIDRKRESTGHPDRDAHRVSVAALSSNRPRICGRGDACTRRQAVRRRLRAGHDPGRVSATRLARRHGEGRGVL
jgi:hypothetical protein